MPLASLLALEAAVVVIVELLLLLLWPNCAIACAPPRHFYLKKTQKKTTCPMKYDDDENSIRFKSRGLLFLFFFLIKRWIRRRHESIENFTWLCMAVTSRCMAVGRLFVPTRKDSFSLFSNWILAGKYAKQLRGGKHYKTTSNNRK